MGLLLLTLTIFGLALHAWLFIEIQLQHLEIVTNGHQYINTTEDEK